MKNRIPSEAHVIIIGAMKAGTTSLYNYLSSHPSICSAITKEPEFFSENQSHGAEVSEYDELWNFNDSIHTYVMEASTGYTKYPVELNVAKNIRDYGIRPKFLYVLRNPFDRIVSHMNFLQRALKIDGRSIDHHLVDVSNYHLQLEQYTKIFPSKSILLLDFDELKTNPRRELERTCRFLDLPTHQLPNSYAVHNATRNVSRLESRILTSNLSPILSYMPSPIKKLGGSLLRHTRRTRALSVSERAQIHDLLNPSMKKLEVDFGIDVQKWGFET